MGRSIELTESQIAFSKKSFSFFIQCLIAKQDVIMTNYSGKNFSTEIFFNEDNCKHLLEVYSNFTDEEYKIFFVNDHKRSVGVTTFFLIYIYFLLYSKQNSYNIAMITSRNSYHLIYDLFNEIAVAFYPFSKMKFTEAGIKTFEIKSNNLSFNIEFDSTYNFLGRSDHYGLIVFDNAKLLNLEKLKSSLDSLNSDKIIMNFNENRDSFEDISAYYEFITFLKEKNAKILNKIN